VRLCIKRQQGDGAVLNPAITAISTITKPVLFPYAKIIEVARQEEFFQGVLILV